jgi:hypothetical protein
MTEVTSGAFQPLNARAVTHTATTASFRILSKYRPFILRHAVWFSDSFVKWTKIKFRIWSVYNRNYYLLLGFDPMQSISMYGTISENEGKSLHRYVGWLYVLAYTTLDAWK